MNAQGIEVTAELPPREPRQKRQRKPRVTREWEIQRAYERGRAAAFGAFVLGVLSGGLVGVLAGLLF